MANFTGFLQINAFTDNQNTHDNVVGEMSVEVGTYSLNPKHYFESRTSLCILSERSVNNAQRVIFDDIQNLVCDVLNDITNIDTELSSTWDFPTPTAPTPEFIAAVKEVLEVGDILTVTGVGDIIFNPVRGEIGDNRHYPAWVTFTVNNTDSEWSYKIWLADSYARTEFSDLTYRVIPPVDQVDDYFNDWPYAKGKTIANSNVAVMSARVDEWLGNHSEAKPATYWLVIDMWMTSPLNSKDIIASSWGIAVNGPSSKFDMETAKSAIVKYIVGNSVYPLSAAATGNNYWYHVLPSLRPIFTVRVVPEYSRLLSVTKAFATLQSVVSNSAETIANHYFYDAVDAHGLNTVLSKMVRGVSVRNSTPWYALVKETEVWQTLLNLAPDYCTINANTAQLNSLSERTIAFSKALDVLLEMAFNFKEGDTLVQPYELVTHEGFNWIQLVVADLEIMVATRESHA